MTKERIINIDWLTLHCVVGTTFDLSARFATLGYTTVLRNSSTRHFRKILDIYTSDNYPVYEIQAEPTSLKSQGGIWRDGASLIKINNRHLYKEGFCANAYDELKRINIHVISISRLDIAMDFQYFDNSLSPKTFIRNFNKNKYWKIGAKKFTCIGEIDENITYEYIRFGAPKSSVRTYLYNKTKELEDVKDKAYIRAIWGEAGIEKGDVWRLEISLKSDAKCMIDLFGEVVKVGERWLNKESGELLPMGALVKKDSKGKYHEVITITIDDLSTKERVMSLYSKLIGHYFKFRYKETGIRKDRAKNVELIKISEYDKAFKPTKILKSHDANRMDKMVVKYLDKLVKENPELLKHVYEIEKELQKKFFFKNLPLD